MYTNIEQRACDLAVFIIDNRATVRSAAKRFGISKSTVHKDLTERPSRRSIRGFINRCVCSWI